MDQAMSEGPRPGATLAKPSRTSTTSKQAEKYHYRCMALANYVRHFLESTPPHLCRLNAPDRDDVRGPVNPRS